MFKHKTSYINNIQESDKELPKKLLKSSTSKARILKLNDHSKMV